MKILLAASEMAPWAKTGDFADSVSDLAIHLKKAGNEVTVVLPFYRCIRENKSLKPKRTKMRFSIQLGSFRFDCLVWEATGVDGVSLYLIEREEFFDRTGVYGVDDRDYQDNAARFLFFSKAIVELARRDNPDVVHVLGWQPAMAPVFLKVQHIGIPSVLSPVSLEFQGNFWSHDFELTNLPSEYFTAETLEFYGSMNYLKAGIVFADAVVLPSGRHVAEMQTSSLGCGLENVLCEHAAKLVGIPSGIDENSMPVLRGDAQSRAKARKALFKDASPLDRIVLVDAPSTNGVGIDLLLSGMDRLPSDELKIVLLGCVEPCHREALEVAIRRHASHFLYFAEPNAEKIATILQAGDFQLIPGPLEARSGFWIQAMRNGIIPIAASCPGLHQSLQDFDPVTDAGNSLLYYRQSVESLLDALRRAAYLDGSDFEKLSSRATNADFSWNGTASRLASLYNRLINRHQRKAA